MTNIWYDLMAQSGSGISSATAKLLRPSKEFTVDTESQTEIPSLGVIIIRKWMTLATNVYRKPTHTGRYFNFKSNHPSHV
jgi:hypothetical protein